MTTKLVVVVDDDPDICNIVKLQLNYHDFSVATTQTEKQLMEILSCRAVGLIVMDMLLSGVDGCDICRKLKEEMHTAVIPLLMFSAQPGAEEMCMKAGANGFIAKPFEMNDLIDKVKSLFQ